MQGQQISQVKHAVDGTLSVGFVTLPFWMQTLGTGLGILAALAGLILAVYRIRIARLELQEKRRQAGEDGSDL